MAKLCRNAKRLPAATLPIAAWIIAAMEPTYSACEYVRPREGSFKLRLTSDRPNRAEANQAEDYFGNKWQHNAAG